MKKLITVQEVEGQGLDALLGKNILVMCLNYFYYGELIGVNEHDIILKNPGIVYETGRWDEKGFKDIQPLPTEEWRVRVSCIESYGEVSQ